jgi:hypothetical protein
VEWEILSVYVHVLRLIYQIFDFVIQSSEKDAEDNASNTGKYVIAQTLWLRYDRIIAGFIRSLECLLRTRIGKNT